MNRAAVIIAVKKAGALPELKAALEGAHRFEAWARQEKFDTVVTITDEMAPVTASAIKRAIRDLVNSDSVEQLFIYFAGHGVNLHYGEYWLLSDAPEDTQEAVNVAGSVQLAKRSGIAHVIFISDACRTAPEGIQAQAIRGSEIFPNQSRGGPQKAVDVFYASLLGEPALEIQDKSASALRYDSLFTAELMAALEGERLTILSRGADQAKVFLRPQPLKRHLISEVPKLVASKLGAASDHTQTPDAEILSDEFAFVQAFDAADPRLKPPPKPAPAPTRPVRPTSTLVQEVLNATTADGHSVVAAVRRSESKVQVTAFESEVTPFESTLVEIPCGFKVRGMSLAAALSAGKTSVELPQPGVAVVHLGELPATSVLLELADGRAVVLPALRDFVGTITFENEDLVDVSYEPSDTPRRENYLRQRQELETLRGLVASSVHRGVFRLERADAPKLTERIRRLKGLDPTLALYAAYSYHRLGNLESIREMEDVLMDDLGVTFFDIARLADRDTKAGPRVVPFVPMLAPSWPLLGAFDAETPLLRELREHVSSRSLWTVFGGAAVERLRTALKESALTKKLVFIHGRAQQEKDSIALKGEWIAAFREGLKKSGLELPIPEEDIRFPYYGDTLDQLVAGADPADAANVIIRGPKGGAEREFLRDVLEEVRKKAGLTDADIAAEIPAEAVERGPLNWGWVQGILQAIDRKVPFGSGNSVALFTRDVYEYLTRSGIRDAIEAGVLQAVHPNEPTVVVSHSLGTVVAYNILRREGVSRHWDIPLFVTLGSPLGVTKIRQSISPTTYPECARSWFNAFDDRDVVALYPLEKPHFSVTPITNKTDVQNHTENRHGIAGYLDDPVVAKTIYDALL